MSVSVAVIYHSTYGHTKKIAEHILKGVNSVSNVKATLLEASEAIEQVDDLVNYDGFVLGSGTAFGALTSDFKKFIESTSPYFMKRTLQDKVCGGFTCSASWAGDKQSVLQELQVFAAQQGMLWVPLGLPPLYNTVDASADTMNRTGFFAGLGAQANVDQTADVAPPIADLLSAEFLGKRVANFTKYVELGKKSLE